MFVRTTPDAVEVQAPAKLNLFFEVLSKRADGYHEIETLLIPIDLFDTLEFRDEPTGQVIMRSTWAEGPQRAASSTVGDLPPPADNLAVKAVQLLRRRCGVERGAALRLVKRIPAAAGLGGASSDAAAALVAANIAWSLGLSAARLADLAAEMGSDVPFFLAAGAAICRGRGERIEPVTPLPVLHVAVVRPPCGLATAEVYRRCQPAAHPRSARPLVDALQAGDLGQAGRLLYNGLAPAAESLTPWIGRLRCELERLDCPGWAMTGSGSCCFALCRHARHARRIAGQLGARGIGRAYAVASWN